MIVLIPCSARKHSRTTTAEHLYGRSSHWRFTLESVRAGIGKTAPIPHRITIVSALHGFVELSDVLVPYDVTIGDPGAIHEPQRRSELVQQIRDLELLGTPVVTFLPRAYLRVVRTVLPVSVDMYEQTRGIGDQRGRLSRLPRETGTVPVPPPERLREMLR